MVQGCLRLAPATTLLVGEGGEAVGAGACPGSAATSGTTRLRILEWGANTSWYRSPCTRGGGMSVASFASSSAGVSVNHTDPRRGRFIR